MIGRARQGATGNAFQLQYGGTMWHRNMENRKVPTYQVHVTPSGVLTSRTRKHNRGRVLQRLNT